MPSGLKGLLILGKKPKDGEDKGGGGSEEIYFGRAFDALKAGNKDAYARNMRMGVEACVEKAQEGGYENDEDEDY